MCNFKLLRVLGGVFLYTWIFRYLKKNKLKAGVLDKQEAMEYHHVCSTDVPETVTSKIHENTGSMAHCSILLDKGLIIGVVYFSVSSARKKEVGISK